MIRPLATFTLPEPRAGRAAQEIAVHGHEVRRNAADAGGTGTVKPRRRLAAETTRPVRAPFGLLLRARPDRNAS
jgi:hypothetical protein